MLCFIVIFLMLEVFSVVVLDDSQQFAWKIISDACQHFELLVTNNRQGILSNRFDCCAVHEETMIFALMEFAKRTLVSSCNQMLHEKLIARIPCSESQLVFGPTFGRHSDRRTIIRTEWARLKLFVKSAKRGGKIIWYTSFFWIFWMALAVVFLGLLLLGQRIVKGLSYHLLSWFKLMFGALLSDGPLGGLQFGQSHWNLVLPHQLRLLFCLYFVQGFTLVLLLQILYLLLRQMHTIFSRILVLFH